MATLPADHAAGLILAFTVEDLEDERARLQAEGVVITMPLTSEEWGERAFQVRDPNGDRATRRLEGTQRDLTPGDCGFPVGDRLLRFAAHESGPAGPNRCRDEQHSSDGEPRVPEDEAPVGLQGAHVRTQPGGVRGEKHLQR